MWESTLKFLGDAVKSPAWWAVVVSGYAAFRVSKETRRWRSQKRDELRLQAAQKVVEPLIEFIGALMLRTFVGQTSDDIRAIEEAQGRSENQSLNDKQKQAIAYSAMMRQRDERIRSEVRAFRKATADCQLYLDAASQTFFDRAWNIYLDMQHMTPLHALWITSPNPVAMGPEYQTALQHVIGREDELITFRTKVIDHFRDLVQFAHV